MKKLFVIFALMASPVYAQYCPACQQMSQDGAAYAAQQQQEAHQARQQQQMEAQQEQINRMQAEQPRYNTSIAGRLGGCC